MKLRTILIITILLVPVFAFFTLWMHSEVISDVGFELLEKNVAVSMRDDGRVSRVSSLEAPVDAETIELILQCPEIELIAIPGSPLSDSQLLRLEQFDKIHTMDIRGTGVSKSSVDSFQASHLECVVLSDYYNHSLDFPFPIPDGRN